EIERHPLLRPRSFPERRCQGWLLLFVCLFLGRVEQQELGPILFPDPAGELQARRRGSSSELRKTEEGVRGLAVTRNQARDSGLQVAAGHRREGLDQFLVEE